MKRSTRALQTAISRRSFLQHGALVLGSLTFSWSRVTEAVISNAAAAPVLSLCADKPFVDCSGVASRYDPRGVLDAARPLMALSEAEYRMVQPYM